MIRTLSGLWLIGASVGLSGCSSAYYVDLAQVRQQRVAMADGPPASTRVAMRPLAAPPARSAARAEVLEPPSPAGRVDNTRPWPKRDTPEFEQFLVEEAERERRIQQVLTSVCRGC